MNFIAKTATGLGNAAMGVAKGIKDAAVSTEQAAVRGFKSGTKSVGSALGVGGGKKKPAAKKKTTSAKKKSAAKKK